MFSSVPCKPRSLRVNTVFIALPALIADIVKPDSRSGVVELLDRAQVMDVTSRHGRDAQERQMPARHPPRDEDGGGPQT